MPKLFLLIALIFTLNGIAQKHEDPETLQPGAKAIDFNLKGIDGKTEEMSIKYGPVATPHAFVFDSKRILQYVGRIDESEKIGTAMQHDLRNAIDAVIAGKEEQVKQIRFNRKYRSKVAG